ncbi:MAG TPA: glycosyltransferase [Roseiarcus sp.]|jgi:hopene-associated glycosyltransferase HpnB|nr:glycosyltransferase [Roseiarcus sp.]
MILAAVSVVPLAIWGYLLFGRGWFWLCRERDDFAAAANKVRNEADVWPSVVAIIPARDEADMIARSVGSLLRQDYSGPFSVVVVDDQSTDGTASIASIAASDARAAERLKIVTGNGPPPGWTGKLSAMRQGLAEVEASAQAPEFVLFTDADIAYAPHVLSRLVSIARTKNSVLTSLMVKLRCESAAERWLAPAFVFFFQMLYPFAWVNDPGPRTAAAAGGCMLVRREALHAAGGLEAVRSALIDDCALGALMKGQGSIWLGLTESVDSLRAYPTFADFHRMVARSAFAELRYSPLRLAGAIGGMALVYVAPPLFAIFAHGGPQVAGAVAWAMMALALAPTLRLYRRPLVCGLALPAIAAAYVVFTVDSALQYWRGRGGYWKGRIQAPMRETGRA